MSQVARPIADISNPSSAWKNVNSGASTNLFSYVDEVSPDDTDADSIRDSGFGPGFPLELKLGTVTDPLVSTDHILTVRLRRLSGTTPASNFWAGIKVGGTTVVTLGALFTGTITSTAADFTYTFSGAEADAISNYGDVRTVFEDQTGLGNLYVCQAYLTVPDVSSQQRMAMLIG